MKFAWIIEPPFNDRTAEGDVIGCDVDLARIILADRLGHTVELVETEFADLIPGLSDGRWEMTTAMFATPERKSHACFSRPIWALTDGLLVAHGNPRGLNGYRSVAQDPEARLALLRNQEQRNTATLHGVNAEQCIEFDTYRAAACAVRDGAVDAYASVARAHHGFLSGNTDWQLDVIAVPDTEKAPAFGSFVVAKDRAGLRDDVDAELNAFLGSTQHRALVGVYGFTASDVDLVLG